MILQVIVEASNYSHWRIFKKNKKTAREASTEAQDTENSSY